MLVLQLRTVQRGICNKNYSRIRSSKYNEPSIRGKKKNEGKELAREDVDGDRSHVSLILIGSGTGIDEGLGKTSEPYIDQVKGVETRGVNVGETEEGLREREELLTPWCGLSSTPTPIGR